jgi:hypothetical protein
MLQVFYDADLIVFPIPNVNPIEMLAWIVFAFITKDPFPGCRIIGFRTFSKQVGTVPVSRPTANALTAFKIIFICQITAANCTINPAWCDKLLRNWIHFFPYPSSCLHVSHMRSSGTSGFESTRRALIVSASGFFITNFLGCNGGDEVIRHPHPSFKHLEEL